MHRIVLTGGPGAGKTVIAGELVGRQPDRLVLVPEAATEIHRRLGIHWHGLDAEARRGVQRQIYRLQVEQEAGVAAAHPGKTMILDRGTVDGAAYWPDGADDYWRAMGTSLAAEYARYDAVIWLETGAALGLYDGGGSNPARHENPPAAVALGRRLEALWSGHRCFGRVEAHRLMEAKIAFVEELVNMF